MRQKLLQDIVNAAIKAGLPPAFTDEAAVANWAGVLVTAAVPVVYDLLLNDPTPPKAFEAETPPTAEEVEAAYNACCDTGGFSKIGDGTILNFLKNVDWAKLLQTILAIISIIPKTPTPAA